MGVLSTPRRPLAISLLSCRCFVQSCVFPLLKHFSSGTSSRSQEITVVITCLRFPLMAHSELLDSLSNNIRSCFATCPAMLDSQCPITRLTMFDSLTKGYSYFKYLVCSVVMVLHLKTLSWALIFIIRLVIFLFLVQKYGEKIATSTNSPSSERFPRLFVFLHEPCNCQTYYLNILSTHPQPEVNNSGM